MYLFRLFSFIFIFQFVLSQKVKEGIPYSQRYQLDNNYYIISLSDVNVQKLINEDLNTDKPGPYRYGFRHEVNIAINNNFFLTTLNNGDKIYRLYFKSKDAFAISLEYKNFYIPFGAELYIYSPDILQHL